MSFPGSLLPRHFQCLKLFIWLDGGSLWLLLSLQMRMVLLIESCASASDLWVTVAVQRETGGVGHTVGHAGLCKILICGNG